MSENSGFKCLNPNNWLQPDFGPVLWPDPEGAPPGTGWLIDVLGPQLSASVPSEVLKLFEVARGAIVYGYLFYPLMTLGERAALQDSGNRLRPEMRRPRHASPGGYLSQDDRMARRSRRDWSGRPSSLGGCPPPPQ